MILSGCMGVRPLVSGAIRSWSWKSATETSMLRMLCTSSCTNFASAGPHPTPRRSNTTISSGKPHPLNTYILWAFSFWTLLIIVSWRGYTQFRLTKKKCGEWGGNYIIHQQNTSRFEGDFRAQSCSGRTMLELVNDISPNCLEICEGKTPSLKK